MQATRTPRQTRSIQTKKRILQATLKLLNQGDFHRIKPQSIAREAGVALGSFYAYFRDKKAVVLESLGQEQKSLVKKIVRAQSLLRIDKSNPLNFLQYWIPAVIAALAAPPRLTQHTRALLNSDPDIFRLHYQTLGFLSQQIETELAVWKNRLRIPDLALASLIVADIMMAASESVAVSPHRRWAKEWMDHLVDMFSRYLFRDDPAAANEHPAAGV